MFFACTQLISLPAPCGPMWLWGDAGHFDLFHRARGLSFFLPCLLTPEELQSSLLNTNHTLIQYLWIVRWVVVRAWVDLDSLATRPTKSSSVSQLSLFAEKFVMITKFKSCTGIHCKVVHVVKGRF